MTDPLHHPVRSSLGWDGRTMPRDRRRSRERLGGNQVEPLWTQRTQSRQTRQRTNGSKQGCIRLAGLAGLVCSISFAQLVG